MKKFAGKYRIQTARAPWWDYANDGAYFVTICTAHRECYFDDVVNGMMKFNEMGEIANNIWDEMYEVSHEADFLHIKEIQKLYNQTLGVFEAYQN